jgi:hypothetical protein
MLAILRSCHVSMPSRHRFDYKVYGHFLNELKKGKAARREHDAYSSYSYYPKG